MSYFVYILASQPNGTLYVGVTNDLAKRVWQHRSGAVDGFTKQHNVHRLVHMEVFDELDAAREREHKLKRWRRSWKIELKEMGNPTWRDLFDELNA